VLHKSAIVGYLKHLSIVVTGLLLVWSHSGKGKHLRYGDAESLFQLKWETPVGLEEVPAAAYYVG
jgi:hypothetical protein